MGGMIYDEDLQRGIKKKHLPPPRVVELGKSMNLEEILCEGKNMFFPKTRVGLDANPAVRLHRVHTWNIGSPENIKLTTNHHLLCCTCSLTQN